MKRRSRKARNPRHVRGPFSPRIRPRLGTAPETRTSLVRPQPHSTRLSGQTLRRSRIFAPIGAALAFVGCGSCRDGLCDREHGATDPTRSSRAKCRRLARSPPLRDSFRASLRSQIAAGQQNRPMQSRQTRDKTLRRQIEKLAQPLSCVPPLFALFVPRYRRLCEIAGQPQLPTAAGLTLR
jgi:hypothetical protein